MKRSHNFNKFFNLSEIGSSHVPSRSYRKSPPQSMGKKSRSSADFLPSLNEQDLDSCFIDSRFQVINESLTSSPLTYSSLEESDSDDLDNRSDLSLDRFRNFDVHDIPSECRYLPTSEIERINSDHISGSHQSHVQSFFGFDVNVLANSLCKLILSNQTDSSTNAVDYISSKNYRAGIIILTPLQSCSLYSLSNYYQK